MTNRSLASAKVAPTMDDAADSQRRPCHGKVDLEASAHDRSRFIGHLAGIMSEPECPHEARQAAMTLIGWLARRMPGEAPHAVGAARAGDAFDRRRKKL